MFKSSIHKLALVLAAFVLGITSLRATAAGLLMDDSLTLRMPEVGDHQVRVITPTMLELTLITTKAPDPATVTQWNFVNSSGALTLPATSEFTVKVNGTTVPVQSIGFKRRVLYAPLKARDLRIGNYLYLQLASQVPTGAAVQVLNPSGTLWNSATLFTVTTDAFRYSPVIHVNQVGYLPALPKKAMIGYYLGSTGELNVAPYTSFQIVNAQSGAAVFTGGLIARRDVGYSYSPTPYQQVLEADFSSFQTPGEYKLVVPGLGASLPFLIDEGVAGTFARTYELGIYHQRCGTDNSMPYTRFTHPDCHTNLVKIPTMTSPEAAFVNSVLNNESMSATNEPRHTAPRMVNIAASLYPFVNQGFIDASHGHHDAGDYSKYTTSVSAFIHNLMFAVDTFPGVKNLDNLGIPESGDGISDVMQEAKWEADYLAKLQDADGGFYFIVYPRGRQYESEALPENGDLQLVLPKNTVATAAAVAALAEIASSPTFKAAYPAAASNYLAKAKAGWKFLQNAIARYGRDGAYQMITFSGNWMMHDDELAWAAAALFAATGDPAYDTDLRTYTPNPNDSNLRRWNWWSMYEGYGRAFRTYAFAARSGRLQASQLNASYLAKCEAEIKFAANSAVSWSGDNAYGSSFSVENKGQRTAGWYFSGEQTFDIATAYLLDPQASYLDVILKNYNYEMGCNPLNMSFLTGVGWRQQREIVHQYAQNDYRVLPPTGVPLGNIQSGFGWNETYKGELTALCYPNDYSNTAPYPMYDRWADAFNVATEFVVSQQTSKSLPAALLLMAMTNVKTQSWKSATGKIAGLPALANSSQAVTASFLVPGLDLSKARIVWEARDQQPYVGPSFTFTPKFAGVQWVEVEAQMQDGRRIVALTNFTAVQSVSATIEQYQSAPLATDTNVLAWYTFDNTYSDARGKEGAITPAANARIDISSFSWPSRLQGAALRVSDLGDEVSVSIPNADLLKSGQTTAISIEAMVYVNSWKGYSRGNATIFALNKAWNAELAVRQNIWKTSPAISGAGQIFVDDVTFANAFKLGQWQHLKILLDSTGYSVLVNGGLVGRTNSTNLQNWGGSGNALLVAGNFDGWIDEIVVKSIGTQGSTTTNNPPPVTPPPTTPPTNSPPPTPGTNYQSSSFTVDASTVALYHLDGNLTDATGKNPVLATTGVARLDTANIGWMASPSGSALRVWNIGDEAMVTLPNVGLYKAAQTKFIAVEAMLYVNAYKGDGTSSAPVLKLNRRWDAQLLLNKDKWSTSPEFWGSAKLFTAASLAPYLKTNCWQKLSLIIDLTGYSIRVNDAEVARYASGDIANWASVGNAALEFGNFDGWIDEVTVRSSTEPYVTPAPPTGSKPVVTVVGTDATASEVGNDFGTFTFSRSGGTTQPLTVNFTLGGTARYGSNYAGIPTAIIIPAGASTVNGIIQPLRDNTFTGPLTVSLTLSTNSAYQLGNSASATTTINDSDKPKLNFTASSSASALGSAPNQLQLSAGAVTGVAYLLQSSTNLIDWKFIATNQAGSALNFTAPISASQTNLYYRTLYVFGSVSAANISSALASRNFSANAVGFANVIAPPGFSLVANPLNTSSNYLNNLLSYVPDGTQIYKFNGQDYSLYIFQGSQGQWSSNPTLNPGEGVFLSNPTRTNLTLTFTGEVLQGTLTNALPSGFSIKGSLVPQSGPLGGTLLGLPGTAGDTVYRFLNGQYVMYIYLDGHGWYGGEENLTPSLKIGEAFYLYKNSPANWVRSFSITN